MHKRSNTQESEKDDATARIHYRLARNRHAYPGNHGENQRAEIQPRLAGIFPNPQGLRIARYSHGAQWGTVLEGQIELTIGGETRTYGPGEAYNIPAGVLHSGKIPAGTKVIDIFEEPERYKLK